MLKEDFGLRILTDEHEGTPIEEVVTIVDATHSVQQPCGIQLLVVNVKWCHYSLVPLLRPALMDFL
jgi:3-deoxy-D-manno-octulosonic acid (KDO) 8-phosphate synthase